jgi:hypothetical protein
MHASCLFYVAQMQKQYNCVDLVALDLARWASLLPSPLQPGNQSLNAIPPPHTKCRLTKLMVCCKKPAVCDCILLVYRPLLPLNADLI